MIKVRLPYKELECLFWWCFDGVSSSRSFAWVDSPSGKGTECGKLKSLAGLQLHAKGEHMGRAECFQKNNAVLCLFQVMN